MAPQAMRVLSVHDEQRWSAMLFMTDYRVEFH